ncbi:hypothetical protein, partial [Azospirillum brasilense]|uniref:hypothetical protein n=1 Tax=Azospirillum brasilense TaxID=192 RepID=UPI001B3B6CE1
MTDHHDSAPAASRRGGDGFPWEAVLHDPARAEGVFLLGLAAARLGRAEAASRWCRRGVRHGGRRRPRPHIRPPSRVAAGRWR